MCVIIIFNFAVQSTLYITNMNTQLEDLKTIRDLMEKSTKFLSLSGLSGISAGIVATIGAAIAYFYILKNPSATDYNLSQEIIILVSIAMLVLIFAMASGVYFSWKKAKKSNQKLFNKLTYKILYHFSIPLVTGGIFSLILLYHGEIYYIASTTLIFYGLALVNTSKFMFNEIQYLGITEIILGILAVLFLHQGILFWTLGFGVCHILYGSIMYFKYDRKV